MLALLPAITALVAICTVVKETLEDK